MSGGGGIEHLPTGSLKLSPTPITCHSHAQSVSVKVLTESGVHGFFNTHYLGDPVHTLLTDLGDPDHLFFIEFCGPCPLRFE